MIAEPDDDDFIPEPKSEVRLSERALPTAQDWAVADGLDALPDAVLLTDLEGRILFVNRAALELLNVSAGEVLGRPLLFFVAKSDCAAVRRALREARSEGGTRVTLRMRPRHARPSVDVEVRARAEAAVCAWVIRERVAPVSVDPAK
jgi:PAS domain S-box-containing protein